MTANLLCADPPAPQRTVELRVTSVDEGEAKLLERLLMRQLGDRLLEDGYRVVPAGESANVRVWIHLGADGATLEARGIERRVETVADGDPQVMALELLQLTTALIDEVRPADAEPRTAIVIEVGGATIDPELRERLQIGLLERGFALTRTAGHDDLRLCVRAENDGVFVHAVDGAQMCESDEAALRVDAGASVEIGRELLLDRAAAALQQYSAGPSAEPTLTVIEPVVEEASPEIEPAPAPAPRPISLALSASGGMLGRAGGIDPLITAELRAGLRRGVGGGLALAVAPSRASDLRVIEYQPTATLDWRLGFARRGLAILAAFAGAHVHTYFYASSAADRGTRLGASVGASVRMAHLGDRGALLFGGVRAGWTGGRWIHLDQGQTSWRRSGVMVGLELGIGWDFLLAGGRR